MADYIGEYASYLRLERRSSDNTITSYVRDVTQFSHYLEEVEETELSHCAQEHIERYISYMTGRGKSAASVARSVASLKSFYGYLLVHRIIPAGRFTSSTFSPISSLTRMPVAYSSSSMAWSR